MIGLALILAIDALVNGERKAIAVTANVDTGVMLTVQPLDTIRWYFETEIDATLYICVTEGASECIDQKLYLYKVQSSLTNMTVRPDDAALFAKSKVFFYVRSAVTGQVFITAHAAIELANEAEFEISEGLVEENRHGTYRFAKFIGSLGPITIAGSASAATSAVVDYYCYNAVAQKQYKKDIQLTENYQIPIEAEFLAQECAVGWLFLTLDYQAATTVSVSFKEEITALEIDTVGQNAKNFPFHEQLLHATLKVKPAEYANSQLLISAYTDMASTFGNIDIAASTWGYQGNAYDASGVMVNYPQYSSQLSILTVNKNISSKDNFRTCTEDVCTLYITISYTTAWFILEKTAQFYQPKDIMILCKKGAIALTTLPASAGFQLTEANEFQQEFAINEFMQTEKWYVNGASSRGYVFYAERQVAGGSVPSGSVNLEHSAGAQGVTFSRVGDALQAIISPKINNYYYNQDGMYFATVRGVDAFTGAFGSHTTYMISETSHVELGNFNSKQRMYFYANVSAFPEYMLCLQYDISESDPGFDVYTSNTMFTPNGAAPEYYDAKSPDEGFIQGNKQYYCVQNKRGDNKVAYFSVLPRGDSGEQKFTVSFGEPYHFVQAVPMGAQTHFFESSTENVYQRLQPLYYYSKHESILRRKIYLEINLMDVPEGQLNISITEVRGGDVVFTSALAAGQQYFAVTTMLPIDRELLLTITSEKAVKLRGHSFFSFIYDEPMAQIVQVQNVKSPILFYTRVEDEHEPAISLRANGTFLTGLKAYICKDQPKLNDDDTYAHDCQTYVFTDSKYDSIVLAQDSELTRDQRSEQSYKFEAGTYYISVLPKSNFDAPQSLSFEYVYVPLLTNAKHTPVRLQRDPMLSALGFTSQAFFAFDAIYKVDMLQSQMLLFDIGVTAQQLCVTFDKPLTYKVLVEDKENCEFYAEDASSIQGTLRTRGLYAYRRVFLNVFGATEIQAKLRNVYFTVFSVERQSNSHSYTLDKATTRASEDVQLVSVTLDGTRTIEIINQLSVSIKDYEQKLIDGSANTTTMFVSDSIAFEFGDCYIDDTSAIQVYFRDYQELQTGHTIYVKIEARVPLTEPAAYKLQFKDDKQIQSKQLIFMDTYALDGVANGSTMQSYVKAVHIPAELDIEICDAPAALQFTSHLSPFVPEPSEATYADVSKYSASEGVLRVPVPASTRDPYYYQNLNYFQGLQQGNASASYRITFTVGSARPALPQEQQLQARLSKSQFTLRFRQARLDRDFDGVLSLGLSAQYMNHSVTYRVYALPEIPDANRVENTLCGLEKHGEPLTPWLAISYSQDQQEITFECEECAKRKNRFALVARDDVSLMGSVYTAVAFSDVKLVTVNTTALVCGIVFGLLGLGLIVLLIWWLIRIRRGRTALYASIQA